jgi:hypothetical protein
MGTALRKERSNNIEGSGIGFVPPEPSSGPPRYDERYIPRWVKVAVVLAAIVIAVIAIIMMAKWPPL